MSFLSKIFGGARSAADVERLLQSGEARKALDVARRLLREQPDDEHLLGLEEQALAAAITAHLDKAEVALDEGFPDDASEWLHLASDLLGGEGEERVAALGARLGRLRERVRTAASASEIEALEQQLVHPTDEEGAEAAAEDFDFEVLVETLLPPAADAYRRVPSPFADAVVALAGGQSADALELLDALRSGPDGEGTPAPVALERGRALLASDRGEEAAVDFEAAWDEFGAEPLDHAGSLAIPELWCEAMLLAGRAESVVDRLRELAEEQEPRLPLLLFRIEALRALERWPEVELLLRDAVSRFPGQPQLIGQLALSRLRAAEVVPSGASDEERLQALLSGSSEPVVGEVRTTLGESVRSVMNRGGSSLDVFSVRLATELHVATDPVDGPRVEELLGVLQHLEGGPSRHSLRLRIALLERTGRSEEAEPLRLALSRS